jgi:hypothetical protein
MVIPSCRIGEHLWHECKSLDDADAPDEVLPPDPELVWQHTRATASISMVGGLVSTVERHSQERQSVDNVTAASLKELFKAETFVSTLDNRQMERRVIVRSKHAVAPVHMHVRECKNSKQFAKRPFYRPVGVARYIVEFYFYDEDGCPIGRYDKEFSTLGKACVEINHYL